jgi:hypothetical protein
MSEGMIQLIEFYLVQLIEFYLVHPSFHAEDVYNDHLNVEEIMLAHYYYQNSSTDRQGMLLSTATR